MPDRDPCPPPLPRYAPAAVAAALAADVRPGGVYVQPVYHDDHCSLLAGRGPCDCDPTVGPPVLLEGAK